MKDIKHLITSRKQYQNVSVQTTFYSKKNTVCYVLFNGKPRVLKWFAPGFKRQFETEYTVLEQGHSVLSLPIPLEKDTKNNVIIMTYISGENLCDIINNEQTSLSEKQRLMQLLAGWFSAFHTHFQHDERYAIRGDSILRNFLFTDRIWGVDFEEARPGKPGEDIAQMCASILTTNPMFTEEKFSLCHQFISHYKQLHRCNLLSISEDIVYALLELIPRRPEDEDVIRNYVERIKHHGIYQ